MSEFIETKEPLYKMIEKKILKLLDEKPYCDGFYLPTETELMNTYSVSRHTIRKSMDELVIKNLITREKGKGTKKIIQSDKIIKTKLNSWKSLSDEMHSKGHAFSYVAKKVELKKQNDELKKLFLTEEKEIVCLHRIGADISPSIYFVSYFNPILNLNKDKNFMACKFTKLYEYLEKNYQIKVARSDEEISAIMPNKEIKKILEITNDQTPILCRKRLVYDDQNRLIEYNIGYYNSDKFTYNVSLIKE